MTAVRRWMYLAPLLACSLLAAACSRPSAFKVGQEDINSTPRASVADGGTLNWPITSLPSNFNPNEVDGAQEDEGALIGAVMPSIFTFGASGQPAVNIDYVTAVTLTATPRQVVTYQINPKAVWSDGTPITAADFVAQFSALNGTNSAYNAASSAGYNQIASVAAGTSPRQVVVTFAQPYADWRRLFSPLLPASLNGNVATFNGGWITGTVVSAGPFVFQNLDPTAKTITLVRSTTWWGQAPKLSSIVFHALGQDPAAQLSALAQGAIDFADIPPEVGYLHTGKAIAGTTVRTAGGPIFRQLTLNGMSPTLSDRRVREAVGLAIDRSAIAKAVLGPLGVPDGELNNHIYMANQRGYRNNAGALATRDLARARTLLGQAGWKLSNGVATKDGQPMQLRLVIPSGVPDATTEANLIKADLKAAGMPLEIQAVPIGQFFNSYVGTGDFDLTIFDWQGTIFPISSSAPLYLSPSKIAGPLRIGENYSRIGSPAIDDLFAVATGTLNQQEDIRLGNEIDAKIWQLSAAIPLYQRPEIFVEKSTLANFGAFGFGTPDFEDIGFTKP